MIDHEKRTLAPKILGQMNALMPRILAASTPLFRFKGDIPELFASALLIKFYDDHFLLTAAHALDNLSDYDLYFGSDDAVRFLDGSPLRTVPPPGGERSDDKIDIGIVRLSEQTIGDMKKSEFLTFADLDISDTATTGGCYLFAGYPGSKNKPSLGKEAQAVLCSFLANPAPLKDYEGACLDPSLSLLLRFNKRNLWSPLGRVTGPDLFGVSGGGVWSLCDQSAVKRPKPLLNSIAIEWWQEQRKCVLATKIHVVLAALGIAFRNSGHFCQNHHKLATGGSNALFRHPG